MEVSTLTPFVRPPPPDLPLMSHPSSCAAKKVCIPLTPKRPQQRKVCTLLGSFLVKAKKKVQTRENMHYFSYVRRADLLQAVCSSFLPPSSLPASPLVSWVSSPPLLTPVSARSSHFPCFSRSAEEVVFIRHLFCNYSILPFAGFVY